MILNFVPFYIYHNKNSILCIKKILWWYSHLIWCGLTYFFLSNNGNVKICPCSFNCLRKFILKKYKWLLLFVFTVRLFLQTLLLSYLCIFLEEIHDKNLHFLVYKLQTSFSVFLHKSRHWILVYFNELHFIGVLWCFRLIKEV